MTADDMLPEPPSADRLREIGIRDDEICVVEPTEVWWRVHRTEGSFVLAWNEYRYYGPVLRFDPHPRPARWHTEHAVWYVSSTPDAALTEAFQGDRTIDRIRERPYLTGLSFTRPLRLLDLAVDSSGAWATRAGGTFAISTAPHSITQRWARLIVEAFPELDGLRYNSRFGGHPCSALFLPAITAMPDRPIMSVPLTHPGLVSRVAAAARRLGYAVI